MEDSKVDSVSISEETQEEPTAIPKAWREMLPQIHCLSSSVSFHK